VPWEEMTSATSDCLLTLFFLPSVPSSLPIRWRLTTKSSPTPCPRVCSSSPSLPGTSTGWTPSGMTCGMSSASVIGTCARYASSIYLLLLFPPPFLPPSPVYSHFCSLFFLLFLLFLFLSFPVTFLFSSWHKYLHPSPPSLPQIRQGRAQDHARPEQHQVFPRGPEPPEEQQVGMDYYCVDRRGDRLVVH